MSTPYCLPYKFNPLPFTSKNSTIPIFRPYHHYSLSIASLRSSLSTDSNDINSGYEREEARWLREEQRWLREEQRWLKEEAKWRAQRESLMRDFFIEDANPTRVGTGGETGERNADICLPEVAQQASLDVPENGIITAQISENLYTEYQVENSSKILKEDLKVTATPKEGANRAAVMSVTESFQIQHKVVEKHINNAENDVTRNRVFLLGENRWEEPSRLIDRNSSIKSCLSCRGEGRMICSECDGSGEPNIEPQFLEWGEEEMKCPYCKGIGFATCDLCDGIEEDLA